MEGRNSTTSIGQGEQARGRVMESMGENNFYLVFSLEEEEDEFVRGELIAMCEEVLLMEANVCKQKNMEGSCV